MEAAFLLVEMPGLRHCEVKNDKVDEDPNRGLLRSLYTSICIPISDIIPFINNTYNIKNRF